MATKVSPRQLALLVVGAVFITYILFQARFIVFGPSVAIEYPTDGAVITTSVITMSGHASNAAWIALNGVQIFTDENGRWSEALPLAPGPSIMSVRVRDRLGREKEDRITITYIK